MYHYFNNSSLTDQLVTDSCSFCWMSHILMTLIWLQSFKKWIIPVKSTVADLRAVHYSPSVGCSGWHHHHSLLLSGATSSEKHRHVETYRFFIFSFQCDVATTRWRWDIWCRLHKHDWRYVRFHHVKRLNAWVKYNFKYGSPCERRHFNLA